MYSGTRNDPISEVSLYQYLSNMFIELSSFRSDGLSHSLPPQMVCPASVCLSANEDSSSL